MKDLLEIVKKTLSFREEAIQVLGIEPKRRKTTLKLFPYDIAIITSTLDEFDSIKNLIDNCSEFLVQNDSHIFYSGTVETKSGKLSVILPVPIAMGIEASVSITTITLNFFSPKYIFMSGICAGNKNVTRIGDIIIAEKALNYNEIVEVEKKGATKVKKFMQNADSINGKLKTKLSLFSRSTIISKIKDSYEDNHLFPEPLACSAGLMVTGSSLVRSETKIAEINDSYHNVKGLDMETSGFYFSCCNTFSEKQPYFVSIKSVSDFGDNITHKLSTQQRKKYALFTSSQAIIRFIKEEL
jgi:nucleoside phosphorylase